MWSLTESDPTLPPPPGPRPAITLPPFFFLAPNILRAPKNTEHNDMKGHEGGDTVNDNRGREQ